MTDNDILKWWGAWRHHTDPRLIAALFKCSSWRVRGWLRSGLVNHEFVAGLATCEKLCVGRWTTKWGIHPLGFVQWHIERLAAGISDAPRLILAIADLWPSIWKTASKASPEIYLGNAPFFSWRQICSDRTLLICAMALIWNGSGYGFGGPFMLGVEMPGEFAGKVLAALKITKNGG